jgi:phage tail-like protein
MWANLDPLTAPQALLPFMAHWGCWQVDSSLGSPTTTALIRRAVELFAGEELVKDCVSI